VLCGQQDVGEGRGDERVTGGIFSDTDGAADEVGVVGDYGVDADADAGNADAGTDDEGEELCDSGVVEQGVWAVAAEQGLHACEREPDGDALQLRFELLVEQCDGAW
jgi:hypothetical protein